MDNGLIGLVGRFVLLPVMVVSNTEKDHVQIQARGMEEITVLEANMAIEHAITNIAQVYLSSFSFTIQKHD